MTYEQLMQKVADLKAQGKEPHGELREMLIDYQLTHMGE